MNEPREELPVESAVLEAVNRARQERGAKPLSSGPPFKTEYPGGTLEEIKRIADETIAGPTR